MFIPNFKILSSIAPQFLMEPFHILFIKIDIPLLALSYFLSPLKRCTRRGFEGKNDGGTEDYHFARVQNCF